MHIDQTEEDLVRLVTARFMPGRFKGRQALEAEAVKGDVVALAKLEMQLGLADKSALRQAYERQLTDVLRGGHQHHFFKLRETLSPEELQKLTRVPHGHRVPWLLGKVARHEKVPEEFVPPEEIKRIQRTQQSRSNETYEQEFQSTLERHLKSRLDEALEKTRWARWRYYRNRVQVVPRGQERVEFESFPRWVWKSGGGWGRGRRRGETVFEMDQRRRWFLSNALLSPATREMQLKNTKGIYLTPSKRVRRGKDNSTMITEVLSTTQPHTQTALPWGTETPKWIRRG